MKMAERKLQYAPHNVIGLKMIIFEEKGWHVTRMKSYFSKIKS